MNDPVRSQVLQAARLLFLPGDLIEVRVPKAGRQKTISGYFQDFEVMAASVEGLESQKLPGIYWTLNPVTAALLARSDHKVKPFADATTNDAEILRRRWLPVDLDPKRPAGISSNEAEHAAALKLAERVREALRIDGWPEPIFADSGNGAHLLYPVDLGNELASAELLKRSLESLAHRFDTAEVNVDRTTFNASRIFKIYGTTARKGDSTADRPHRPSRILETPALVAPVSLLLLDSLAKMAPTPARAPRQAGSGRQARTEFDLRSFLDRHGIRYQHERDFQDGRKFVLDECPFDTSHKAPDSAVFQFADGHLGFRCLHNSCHDYQWTHFRDHFEPNRPRGQQPWKPRTPAPPPLADADVPPDVAAAGTAGDSCDENLALSAADVEAAVDAAITQADLSGAMRLIPDIAGQAPHVQALIVAKLRQKFKRDFPTRDFMRGVRAVEQELAQKNAPAVPEDELPPEDAPDLLGFPLTDSGNGERIVLMFGEDIRFCSEFKKWLLWDGRRWKIDTDAATVTQKAKNMARLLYKQAGLLQETGLKKLIQDHARASESQQSISAALLRAKSEPGMAIAAAELDQHRYLLNCLNGVVDTRTGELLPSERKYYITKLCYVKYNANSDPEKDCPRFLKLIRWAMGETPDVGEIPERVTRMVSFLQKSFGYALTGDVSEKAAFIFYGAKGNNGKTTLLTVFKTLLAEYATQLDINTLMTSKFTDNNVRADLAKLHGARFVITSEVDDGQRLSERLMKYLTAGMGEITACRKFENPFEFHATHKIWMDCNYRPEIKGADEAIWSRLKCVPFLQRIDKKDPEIDKQLINKLVAEGEGILAWTIRGTMRWFKDGGLGDPPEIEAAVTEWRDDDDPLKGFFEECCELDLTDPDYFVRCAEFTKAYQAWCKDNNEPQLKASRLTQRLVLKGIKLNRSRRISVNGKQVRCWDGVRLREDVTLVSMPRSSGAIGSSGL